MVLDRIKKALFELIRSANPAAEFGRPARARFLRQRGVSRVDVRPDDQDLPQMANIPLKVGAPGIEVTLPGGQHTILIAWEDGRPDRPIACLWDPGTGGAVPLGVRWHAQLLELGGVTTPVRDGLVHGQGTDPFTGLQYWMLGSTSNVVRGKK